MTSEKTYENHEAATIFPDMAKDQYENLKNDIEQHGLRDAIVLYDGKIVDGIHRYKICQELGITPTFTELDPDTNPYEYAFSRNFTRRHLTISQQAAVAYEYQKKNKSWQKKFEKMREKANKRRSQSMTGNQNASKEYQPAEAGVDPSPPKPRNTKLAALANEVGVSERLLQQVQQIDKKDKVLVIKILQGLCSIDEALRILRSREKQGKPLAVHLKGVPAWLRGLEVERFRYHLKHSDYERPCDNILILLASLYEQAAPGEKDDAFGEWLRTIEDERIQQYLSDHSRSVKEDNQDSTESTCAEVVSCM